VRDQGGPNVHRSPLHGFTGSEIVTWRSGPWSGPFPFLINAFSTCILVRLKFYSASFFPGKR